MSNIAVDNTINYELVNCGMAGWVALKPKVFISILTNPQTENIIKIPSNPKIRTFFASSTFFSLAPATKYLNIPQVKTNTAKPITKIIR